MSTSEPAARRGYMLFAFTGIITGQNLHLGLPLLTARM